MQHLATEDPADRPSGGGVLVGGDPEGLSAGRVGELPQKPASGIPVSMFAQHLGSDE